MGNSDINLIPMEDLIREIESRCKVFICAYQTPEQRDKTGNVMYWFGKGAWMDSLEWRVADIAEN